MREEKLGSTENSTMLSGKGKKEISIEKATGHYYFY
jgi:hypothetical protein